MLNYIPAIDIKNNVIVTGTKGNRSLYKSISKKYKLNHNLIKFLEHIFKKKTYKHVYIADLNAIHNQSKINYSSISKALKKFPNTTFIIDSGSKKFFDLREYSMYKNYIPILSSESYQNYSILFKRKYTRFIFSVDKKNNIILGEKRKYYKNIRCLSLIMMNIDRIGSNKGIEIEYLNKIKNSNNYNSFIVAGGFKESDETILKKLSIREVICLSEVLRNL
tara:strand:- start:324 stop:986 length:663 start_codon:yes stop_codon:yes gene_type:complete